MTIQEIEAHIAALKQSEKEWKAYLKWRKKQGDVSAADEGSQPPPPPPTVPPTHS